MSVFPFIEAEKLQRRNVVKACELLEASRSAFYSWHQHLPSARQVADDELGELIESIYGESRGTYGWPRVTSSSATTACTPAASGSPGSCANGG